MANGSGKFNNTHAFAANFAPGDFHTTSLANDALVLDLLVTTARAFPVLGWAENSLAEKAVALRLERTVIDSFRLLHFIENEGPGIVFPLGPLPDFVRACDTDSNFVEKSDVCHKIGYTTTQSLKG